MMLLKGDLALVWQGKAPKRQEYRRVNIKILRSCGGATEYVKAVLKVT